MFFDKHAMEEKNGHAFAMGEKNRVVRLNEFV
jgi:hypothetical protein